jgi:hypothetical protein
MINRRQKKARDAENRCKLWKGGALTRTMLDAGGIDSVSP